MMNEVEQKPRLVATLLVFDHMTSYSHYVQTILATMP